MLRTQIRKTIKKKRLIEKGDRVLVCVSGGPDSMALLHLLMGYSKEWGIDLTVAHLDHMIRGGQSKKDADFVRNFCEKNRIDIICEKVDVKRHARSSKSSLEEVARDIRYGFYQTAAFKSKANKIATGHTLDDQAETVLMRLIKGAGSRGLSGMPYKRLLGNIWVIRPLLDVRRRDIEIYLKKNRISSRADASNLQTKYLRNRIRHVLMPLLEKKFNPNIKQNLCFLAETLSGEFDYMNNIARNKFKALSAIEKDSIAIKTKSLGRQHVSLQRLIIRNAIERLKGNLRKISYRHWEAIEAMLSDSGTARLSLPGRISVTRKKGHIILSTGTTGQSHAKRSKKTGLLDIPGELNMPELGIKVRAELVGKIPIFHRGKKRKKVEYINGDAVTSPLRVRTWRNGDKIRPLGMRGYKKMHDIFVDEKIDICERSKIPIVFSGQRMVWAGGVKLSDDFKVRGRSKKTIRLSLHKIR